MTDAETIVAAMNGLHELEFALGCILAFGLGWIGGHQR